MPTQFDLPIAGEMEQKPDAFMVLVDKLKGMPPESIGAVLDSYERFLKIQAKQAFDAAMGGLKKNIPQIVKNRLADMNGKYTYKYATLEDICDKLDPALTSHGFGYRWTTHPSDKGVVIGCVLTHLQGHSEETLMPVAPHDSSGGKNPIQAIGSTLSYLQRYSLLMALGIAPRNVDTDGKPPEAKPELPKLEEWLQTIKDSASFEELEQKYKEAYKAASGAKDQQAKDQIVFWKNTRKEQLRKGGAK
jgi:hypothetical protein